MKTKKVKQKHIGRFVRVMFADIGAQDGVITRVDGDNDFHFLPLGTQAGETHNNAAPAVALGNYIDAMDTGLDK